MAVQFILGRSGTGKTRHCIEAIVNALVAAGDQPLVFLVPEQATYQAERTILSDARIRGYHRLQILSFERLQFLLLGRSTARPPISQIGRQMIVHSVLRANQKNLRLFHSSAVLPGLARQVAGTISELHDYAITPQRLDELLSKLRENKMARLAELKFEDLALVLKEYLRFIEDRFTNPDFQLAEACAAVPLAGFLHGARLWVDGFAGFTSAEATVLLELLKIAADAHIALCLDPTRIDVNHPQVSADPSSGLFEPTNRTYADLVDRIRQVGLDVSRPILLTKAVRFRAGPALAHVERDIFHSGAAKQKAGGGIRIIAASNPREEVRWAAREIASLVRSRGYRYRDIALVASDLGMYEHYVSAYFDSYGLPYFIDKRRPLNHHSLVRLICAGLSAVLNGFNHDDVFACLKTDLIPLARSEIDLLENYCLAYGVSGSDWIDDEPWRFADKADGFNEEEIDRIRRAAIEPLLELRNALVGGDGPAPIAPADFVRALFGFLDKAGARTRLGQWVEMAVERGDPAAAQEHRQLYDRIVDVLDELVEVFGSRELAAADYLELLKAAFAQLTLAFIPPTLDQVLVGSIERSRHPDLKAVFLLGATQRQFPVTLPATGVLSDEDRQFAETAGFRLAPDTAQRLAERRYLAYIAFTRPSELLYVSFPAVDDRGSAVARSHFIDDLQELFDDLPEQHAAAEHADVEEIRSRGELAELLCSRLGRDLLMVDAGQASRLGGFLDALRAEPQLGDVAATVVSALAYDNRAVLDGEIVGQLFGPRIRASASRLSAFAACPYRYFAKYTLELAERKELKLEPLDLGDFYHRVLDGLLRRLKSKGQDWASLDQAALLEVLDQQIQEHCAQSAFLRNFARRRVHNTFILNSAAAVLRDFVPATALMIRAGAFRPAASEVGFGAVTDPADNLGAYEIPLGDERIVSIDGKIDRLDLAEVAGCRYLMLVDYKRTQERASFGWSRFFHGLDLQLQIYLLAVRHIGFRGTREGIGAFYIPIELRVQRAAPADLEKKERQFRYKARGIFDGALAPSLHANVSGWSGFYNFFVKQDGGLYGNYERSAALQREDFEAVLAYAQMKILDLVRRMVQGRVDVQPYRLNERSPCSYCEYRPVCRFDWQINEYNALESLGKEDVLKRISGA